jgi:hypothetical protein
VVTSSFFFVDIGEDRPQIEVPVPSARMAESIVNDFAGAQIGTRDGARPGLGWLPGNISRTDLLTKHAGTLKELRNVQERWFLNLIKLADDDWTRYHKHHVISDTQRFAAKALGYTGREWLVDPLSMSSQNCPACTTPIVPGTIICPNCRVVLDAEKAKGFVFAK